VISPQDIECCIDLIVSRSGKITLSQLLYIGVCLTKVYESTYLVRQWFVNQVRHVFMYHTQPIKEYNMAVVPPGSVECAPELTHFFHPESSAAILICYSAMDKPSCNLLLRISRLMKRRYNRSWNMKRLWLRENDPLSC
jgi:hypothetical protein